MLGWLILILLALLGLFFLAGGQDATLFGQPDQTIYLVAVAFILGVYALWLIGSYRERLGQAFLYLAVWLGLGLVLVAGYSYRDEFAGLANRVAGELLLPGQAVAVEPGPSGKSAVRIRGRGDGHFVARAKINGAATTLLVDTGASAVVLTPRDARRAGIDVNSLSYTVPVATANGQTFAARVRLKTISIDAIVVRDVDALVAKPGGLQENLLGMSFLGRLGSYEFSRDFLTFRS